MPEPERLWALADLAAYLGYAVTTVERMSTQAPDRLPPRVAGLRNRWSPDVVRAWAKERSGASTKPAPVKIGRPRRVA